MMMCNHHLSVIGSKCNDGFEFARTMTSHDEAEMWLSDDTSDDGKDEMAMLPEDAEVWSDYWSGELSSLWLACKEFVQSQGWPVLDRCTHADFIHFCYSHSSQRIRNLERLLDDHQRS